MSLHVHGHIVLLVQTDVAVTDEVQGVYVSSWLSRSSEGKRGSRSPSNEANPLHGQQFSAVHLAQDEEPPLVLWFGESRGQGLVLLGLTERRRRKEAGKENDCLIINQWH